ncbi:hypothetical protein [Capnocytophaga canis]|uniref:hypothetical protein n=1 Tax=Capnocytophaga canis TaxID=1848903 RepID=UPI0037D89420
MKNFIPINTNVLVEPIALKNESGLKLFDEVPVVGKVIKVGDGTPQWTEMKCKEGDIVMWHRNSGHLIEIDGRRYVVLSEEKREIIGICEI